MKKGNAPSQKREWEMMNAIPNAVAVLDGEGRIVFVNTAWTTASTRWPTAKIAAGGKKIGGQHYLAACDGLNREVFLPSVATVRFGLDAVLKGTLEGFACEYTGAHPPPGKVHRFSLHIAPTPSGSGAVVSHSDLGEENRAIPERRGLLQTLLNEARDAVFVCDPQGRVLVANPATAQWLGVEVADLIDHKASRVLPPELRPFLLDQHQETLALNQTHTYETTSATVHGARTFNVTKGVCRTARGKVKGVFTVARDISEIKVMEREIIETSDKEKQRLGQELHENLCQYLVGISLLGNVLFEDLLRLELKQAEDARQITSLVKDAIAEVRALAKGLAPMPQEQEEGLIAALQELANQARAIGKIRCSLRVPRSASFVNPATGIHLFRIAQEAVHNAIKHSQAERIQIALSVNRRNIVLSIQDNGVGVDHKATHDPGSSSRLGLHIMNYRSRAIGAELAILPREGGGTVVSCTLPKL